MKVLFFGGAFNPLTVAHLELAKEMKEEFHFDKVLFVPTKSKYILNTEKKDFSFSEEERYSMLEKVKEHHDFMMVSDIEIRNPEQNRTYLTLKKLKEMGYELSFLIGSDWLKDFESKWIYVDELLSEFPLYVIERDGDDVSSIIDSIPFLKKRKQYFHIYHPKGNYFGISSSAVRKYLLDFSSHREEIRKMVPIEVYTYIERKYAMKENLLKVSLCHPSMKVSDVLYNTEKMIELLSRQEDNTAIYLFPELSLTGYTIQDLVFQSSLLNEVLSSIEKLKEASKEKAGLLVFGAPLKKDNKIYNCAILLQKGKVLGVVPKTYIPNYGEFYEARWFASGKDTTSTIHLLEEEVPFGTDLLFSDRNSDAVIALEICEDLWVADKPSTHYALNGANVILNLSASDENIQKREYRRNLVSMQSATTYSAYVYCSSSTEESSQDLVFSGHSLLAENGTILQEEIYPNSDSFLTGIIDLDKIIYNRLHQSTFQNEKEKEYRTISISLPSLFSPLMNIEEKAKLLEKENYPISPYPFVPSFKEDRKRRAFEILEIQAHAIATRVKNTGLKNLVIGVSGGLDSTLALLVLSEAKKIVPEIHILGVTMPKSGNTSSLTYQNSLALLDCLADEKKEIDIEKGVEEHLKEISHSLSYLGEGDITYENAQARYRTYLLMDLANMNHGLVIGTGDLSELALGWCTYNGDHMSMYGVNCSIPKTLVKYIVQAYSEDTKDEKLKETLNSIIHTPISPELTPSKDGVIEQKTEDKIGKYDLNDFFLYYVLRYGFTEEKILLFALKAYPNLTKEEIKEAMIRFFKRFYTQQFKRSCLPDGVKVGSVSLSPRGDFRMASDCSVSSVLERIKEL